ncbi:MAG: hypothetical protein QMC93_02595 [Patescibacteria group bacterium]|nr:hypothetical protein [Patescibacteria group bacterium]
MDKENPLKNLIEIIKTGSPEEVKVAQKQVEKFWHEVYIPKREEGRKAFSIFLDEIKEFDKIQDIDHQAYLINTLKWPFFSIGEEYFEEWTNFVLKCIQHPSGKIRQAILKATEWLVLDIAVDVKFDLDSKRKISQEEKERIEKNKNCFGYFVSATEELLEKYYEPRFNRYKYIKSLPVGVYKSLQKLMVEVFLRSEHYEKIYEDFLKRKALETKEAKQTEEELQALINEYHLKERLTTEMIRDWVWEARGETVAEAANKFQKKVFSYFREVKSIEELNKILRIFNNAWNYFPHKTLGGRSPKQMVEKELKKNPQLRREKTKKMPEVIVGGRKLSWDAYWMMIKEMEELQKPFKKWSEEEVLPEYKNFLSNEEKLAPDIVKKHYEVA